jgi:hypothetical protein
MCETIDQIFALIFTNVDSAPLFILTCLYLYFLYCHVNILRVWFALQSTIL